MGESERSFVKVLLGHIACLRALSEEYSKPGYLYYCKKTKYDYPVN